MQTFFTCLLYMFNCCLLIYTYAVVSLLASGPVVVTEERAVRVSFNDAVLDNSASRVMFSSNCTGPTTVDYQTTVWITIPEARSDIRFDDSRCHYTIQLVDGMSRPIIGPPITGFFNITGNNCDWADIVCHALTVLQCINTSIYLCS